MIFLCSTNNHEHQLPSIQACAPNELTVTTQAGLAQ